MICLTGDVHHMSMRGLDQFLLRGTEVDASFRYIDIASRFGINVTLFVTGRCVAEEHRRLAALAACGEIELGGHNYYAFKPLLPYRVSQLLLRRRNGPAFLQKREIDSTIKIFKEALSVDIVSWRNHGYRHDVNTRKLLFSSGIKYFSDIRSSTLLAPYWEGGLIQVPINVLPDHDQIYHGSFQDRSPAHQVAVRSRSPFGRGRMEIADWLETIKQQIESIIAKGGLATLLVHPACMEISDNFKTFAELCGFLATFQTVTMCQSVGDRD